MYNKHTKTMYYSETDDTAQYQHVIDTHVTHLLARANNTMTD